LLVTYDNKDSYQNNKKELSLNINDLAKEV